MKQTIKPIIALALCLSIVLCLAACGGSDYTIPTTRFEPTTIADLGIEIGTNGYEETPEYPQSDAEQVSVITGNENGDLRYVMIYNPNIYKDEDYVIPGSLSTGTLGMQVDTSMVKADGLEMPTDYPYVPWEQMELKDLPIDQMNFDGDRAGTMLTPYSVGDTKTFYCFDTASNRTYADFTCMYTGTNCNIWTFDSQFNTVAAEIYSAAFDNDVYPAMLQYAGTGRFADNGGKVNLLFYPMEDGVLGCFTLQDIFSSSEVPADMAAQYGFNTDHAILNINSSYAIYQELVNLVSSTMAHEFQHLICATDLVYALNESYATTWLNEAMSGYLEEFLYPGAKEQAGHYSAFATSDRIRYGQSLYNFDNDEDIGVYGSVYLFAEYLANLASKSSTYRNFHDSWRNSFSMSICDAEGLFNIVPSSEADRINNMVEFSDSVSFANVDEEFMSKLTLDFYMSLFDSASGDSGIAAYNNVDMFTLLYDEINGASIEGGGRIIVAVSNNSFEIPADADQGLVYVGFDENFNPITPFITN